MEESSASTLLTHLSDLFKNQFSGKFKLFKNKLALPSVLLLCQRVPGCWISQSVAAYMKVNHCCFIPLGLRVAC